MTFAITPGNAAFEAAIRGMTQTIIGYVITNGFVNQLFVNSVYVNNFNSVGDCSTCGSCGHYAAFGTWLGGDSFQSEQSNNHRVAIMVNANTYAFDPAQHCGGEMTCSISNLSLPGNNHPAETYRVYDSAGTLIYISSTTPWPSNLCGRAFYIKKTASFTVDLTFSSGGC